MILSGLQSALLTDSVTSFTVLGSVNAGNCDTLAAEADIDGFLVGGASLKSPDFITIIQASSKSA